MLLFICYATEVIMQKSSVRRSKGPPRPKSPKEWMRDKTKAANAAANRSRGLAKRLMPK